MRRWLVIAAALLSLAGCGTYTTVEMHGGVKCVVVHKEINNAVRTLSCPPVQP